MADWLDKTFYRLDSGLFELMNRLHFAAGGFFDRACKYVSFLGKSGWFFILLAFVLLFFKSTRKEGLAMAFALVIGALVTNIILKNAVDRARPFYRNATFADFWQLAGANFEDSSSFPSGHTTAAFAAAVAFFIIGDKRYSWTGLVFALFMGFSRIYLIVHYPSDVLAGIIVGSVGGAIGALLCKLTYKKSRGKFKKLLANFDMIDLCKRKRKKTDESPSPREEKLSASKD